MKSETSAEAKRKELMQRFKAIMEADKKKMQEMEDQNPHSRAYASTCSFTKSKTLAKEEEK